MAPMANDEHQDLVAGITTALRIAVQSAGMGLIRPGVNISDQQDDWTSNYRCPDVVAFLNDTQAENRETHWYGGPDFAVEIISPNDRAREKLEFYAKVNTLELLIVDRDPWALELYRMQDKKLVLAGKSTLDDSAVLSSDVVPLSWQLIPGDKRPNTEVSHTDGKQSWTV
jgi:Uma2 family endonuclease